MIINLILVIVWIYLYAFEKMRLVKTLKSEIMMYRKFLLTSVLLFISMVAFAQSRITGYVTDPQGEPIIGANVVIKGTTIGTITDIDGKFSLSTENKSCILKVSFLGYKN